MNVERAKRYRDKLNLVMERIEDIESWTSNEKIYFSDKKTRLAIYKAAQELIEGSMDIIAMICKDSRLVPKDDYANIEALHSKKMINAKLRNILADANGLRNRIVHRYNSLNDKIAYDSIKALLPGLEEFTKVVKRWLAKKR